MKLPTPGGYKCDLLPDDKPGFDHRANFAYNVGLSSIVTLCTVHNLGVKHNTALCTNILIL